MIPHVLVLLMFLILVDMTKIKMSNASVVAHICNPRARKAETGRHPRLSDQLTPGLYDTLI